jgi:hypothetical protein
MKKKFEEEENRWVRGFVYWQRGVEKQRALEKADKDIEEIKLRRKNAYIELEVNNVKR